MPPFIGSSSSVMLHETGSRVVSVRRTTVEVRLVTLDKGGTLDSRIAFDLIVPTSVLNGSGLRRKSTSIGRPRDGKIIRVET